MKNFIYLFIFLRKKLLYLSLLEASSYSLSLCEPRRLLRAQLRIYVLEDELLDPVETGTIWHFSYSQLPNYSGLSLIFVMKPSLV